MHYVNISDRYIKIQQYNEQIKARCIFRNFDFYRIVTFLVLGDMYMLQCINLKMRYLGWVYTNW